ncbi:maleylacetoacetate isomerase [Pacificimonas sp. WHA3]|uniref:Maleylacetoacetate isomerase n=1 Tax=Pacificimonas pallii TaxID=2827236 RepID=A0ABS6SIT3_9SPHN|nr:maleylacetoacetate isomerase [Pacificimonas pallii]MBV7257846.1 maleylacetoacetate isomerase [Pacificimonas pallii]
MSDRILYDYWRSTAAYRVRIVLHLKGLEHDHKSVDLVKGAQSGVGFKMLNPHGRVPYLIDGEVGLNQSLAICEYLDEVYPEPTILPGDAATRARIRGAAQIIACDVHPLNNLSVLNYLKGELGQDEDAVRDWYHHWIDTGFRALEEQAEAAAGPYLFGDRVTLADICLAPQMYNARRFRMNLEPYPGLVEIDKKLLEHDAFRAARPEAQEDAN